ncbi:hypothetical protein GCM10010341_27700 [Streptomyces noursei]|nr:hypothetical protein GCM10010341_27700 [Streptomyces noursei]
MLSFEYPYSDAEMSRYADGPAPAWTEEWGPRTGSGAAPPTRGGGAAWLPDVTEEPTGEDGGLHGGVRGKDGGGAALVGSVGGTICARAAPMCAGTGRPLRRGAR